MKDWLREYLKYNKDTEIPELFALWCGILGISALLARRVFIDRGHFMVYPNLYTVLIAGSGKLRKSTSISQIENLLQELEKPINLIAQKITTEALITALKSVKVESETEVYQESVGFLIADEFKTFLNKRTYEAGIPELLNPLYDCKKRFTYRTKGGGSEIITNACLSILGGTTMEWLKDSFPEKTFAGGLTSRFIFVYLEDAPPPASWTQPTKEKMELKTWLIDQMETIRLLEGEITLTKPALSFYKEEYDKFYFESPLYNDPNLSGYASRRFIHILKLAIIFAVSQRRSLVIEKGDIEASKVLLEQTEKNLPSITKYATQS